MHNLGLLKHEGLADFKPEYYCIKVTNFCALNLISYLVTIATISVILKLFNRYFNLPVCSVLKGTVCCVLIQ